MDGARGGVVVAGGGIAGAAAARWLASDHRVRIIEQGRVAGGATGHASGLVSIAADYAAHPDLARFALRFFETDDGGRSSGYTDRPNVGLVTDGDRSAARAKADRLAAAGLAVAYRDGEALEERFPNVFDLTGFAGGIEYPGGWVDPHALTQAYLADARAEGVRVETGVTVEEVLVEDGAVVGVATDAGRVPADTVVVAAGWRTRDLVAPFVEVPLRPFRYQTVNLDVDRELGAAYPIAWEHETYLYWRPEHNGELHVGGGTYFVDGTERRGSVTRSFRELVASTLADRLCGLGDPRIVGEGCCPTGDAATPDGYPVIDAPAEGPDGLVVATGLTGYGIMASPVVGQAVRSLVTGEPASFPLDPLCLDRFEARGTDFTLPYIVEDPAELAPSA